MKKFMMGMMVLSVMVFGANVQLKTPQMKVVTPASGLAVPSPEVLKSAKKIEFVKTEPAQLILKVPIDIDPLPNNISYKGMHIQNQDLLCVFNRWNPKGELMESYIQRIQLHGGQYTVKIQVNNLSLPDLLSIKSYFCAVEYATAGGARYFATAMNRGMFKTLDTTTTGNVNFSQ